MRMRFGFVHFHGGVDSEGFEYSACGLFGEELTTESSRVTCEECLRLRR
jgi:hypothetical protein